MKSGLLFNCIQETFSRGYSLLTGNEPYPLRSLLAQYYEKVGPKRILDVGCGSGRYAIPGYDYLGIDPNPDYVANCRRNRSGRFEQMSAENLNLPDKSYDVVLWLSVGHHLPDDRLRRVCHEIRRVLTDDGILIFADPVRPVVEFRPAAAVLEWLDEGDWFREEEDYVRLLGEEFVITEEQKIIDQFYRTLVLFCRRKPAMQPAGVPITKIKAATPEEQNVS